MEHQIMTMKMETLTPTMEREALTLTMDMEGQMEMEFQTLSMSMLATDHTQTPLIWLKTAAAGSQVLIPNQVAMN